MVRVSVGEGGGRGIGSRRRKQENYSCTILGSITVWVGMEKEKGVFCIKKASKKAVKMA